MCGEQRISVRIVIFATGSSPRVRGTGYLRRLGYVLPSGSSPRVRGTGRSSSPSTRNHRFIPAVCGEQPSILSCQISACGSSPRVRGTVPLSSFDSATPRFIPACAGNSSYFEILTTAIAVHPRVCGEQIERQAVLELDRGFIPACAGNSFYPCSPVDIRPVHPRVCGEQQVPHTKLPVALGSSPRVRGTAYHDPALLLLSRFIPACAGNRSQS